MPNLRTNAPALRSLFSIACLALLTVLATSQASAGRRIALLIGNQSYAEQVGPLKNPKNDIKAIQATLESIGFKPEDIQSVPDGTRIDILTAIDTLAARAKDLGPDDVVFFYYSGHGAAPPGRGMSLIPIDAKDATSNQLWYDTVDLESGVIGTFEKAHSGATWILAIDACRNELNLPTRALGDGDKGFVLSDPSAGMLISYAAGKGKTARDQTGGSINSPYAQALMEEIRRPGRPISSTFAALTKNVLKRTNNVQKPDLALNVIDDPILVEAPQVAAPAQLPAIAPAPAPQVTPPVGAPGRFSRHTPALTDVQLATMDAMVSVFESGRAGLYGAVARIPGDNAGLSYGVHQASLGSGNLFKLLSAYCAKPGAGYCEALKPYLPRLAAKDQALNTDAEIYSLLKSAATDPVMAETQEDFFFDVYQKPALAKWSQFGFTTALSASVIHDSYSHGNFDQIAKRTNARYGEPTAQNEKDWTAGYVATRKEWLQTHPNQGLHNTAIRMVAFENLIANNNWNLTFPLNLARLGDRIYPLTPYDLGEWLFQDPIHRLGAAQFGVAKVDEASAPNGRNRFVQLALTDLGYLPGGIVDGQFGPGTAQAVKTFQKKMSLPQTGEVEGATFDALCRELEKKLPSDGLVNAQPADAGLKPVSDSKPPAVAGAATAGAGATGLTSPPNTP